MHNLKNPKIDVRPVFGPLAGADAKEIHIECVCLLARPDCCRSVDYLDCVYRFDIFRCSIDYLDCGICKNVFDVEVYEAGSQVGICENQWTPFFEDFRTHMFQSVEKYLDVVGTWLMVRLKADDSYF